MKDRITQEQSSTEKIVNNQESTKENFIVEYKSSCNECALDIEYSEETKKTESKELGLSTENRVFICLCSELKSS